MLLLCSLNPLNIPSIVIYKPKQGNQRKQLSCGRGRLARGDETYQNNPQFSKITIPITKLSKTCNPITIYSSTTYLRQITDYKITIYFQLDSSQFIPRRMRGYFYTSFEQFGYPYDWHNERSSTGHDAPPASSHR